MLAGRADVPGPGPHAAVQADERPAAALLRGQLGVQALDASEHLGHVRAVQPLQRDVGQDGQNPVPPGYPQPLGRDARSRFLPASQACHASPVLIPVDAGSRPPLVPWAGPQAAAPVPPILAVLPRGWRPPGR